ncbi:MAG: hypothetical protein ABSB75_04465 [Candidatus Limnocylindrales bacterium]
MSWEEKSAWIQGVLGTLVPVVYFVNILGQARNTAVAKIAYQQPLLITIGVMIGLFVAGYIVAYIATYIATYVRAEAASPGAGDKLDADKLHIDKTDERDKKINQFGEYVGLTVLSVCMLVPFGLAMMDRETFWIANTMFAAGVVSGLVSAVVKIVTYRRGR